MKKCFVNDDTSYATGFVNPKTTALFFDKLWIPDQYAEQFQIPKELVVNSRDSIDYAMLERLDELSPPIPEALKTVLKAYYPDGLVPITWVDTAGIALDLKQDPPREVFMLYPDESQFITSINRNEALRIVSNLYYQRKKKIVPIFFNKTDFEESFRIHGSTDYNGRRILYKEEHFLQNKQSQANVIEATIKNVAMIIEDSLTWDQVKQIRQDKSSIAKLKRFKQWAAKNLTGSTNEEIREYLDNTIEEYEYALKSHGVMTALGGFTTILSSASTVVAALEGTNTGYVAAGAAVSASAISFSVQRLYDLMTIKNSL